MNRPQASSDILEMKKRASRVRAILGRAKIQKDDLLGLRDQLHKMLEIVESQIAATHDDQG